jgi:hypothetical protein
VSEARLPEREPLLVAGGGASALVGAFVAVLAAFGVVDVRQASAVEGLGFALIAVAPLLASAWARRRVMPVDTVTRAGHDPDRVLADAANPAVPAYVSPWRRVAPGVYEGPRGFTLRRDGRTWFVLASGNVLGYRDTLADAKVLAARIPNPFQG